MGQVMGFMMHMHINSVSEVAMSRKTMCYSINASVKIPGPSESKAETIRTIGKPIRCSLRILWDTTALFLQDTGTLHDLEISVYSWSKRGKDWL